MHRSRKISSLFGIIAQAISLYAIWQPSALAAKPVYPAMAPVGEYLMSEQSEIPLARSAAPSSISGEATVMVLGKTGYTTAENGTNGFLCLVERSWGTPTTDSRFWNPRIRGPICFNPQAARSFAPIYLMKTRLVLSGKTKAEIAAMLASAFNAKKLPALEPSAMCFMLSRQQYLDDRDKNWHPHLMFFSSGSVAKDWGANLPVSPVIAENDPEERATIFMVLADRWSNGMPAMQTTR